ncbi:MAG: WbqC family protein [Bacillota bacterium]
MIIGILQPGYLPWLGFFEQLYRSDIFVIYDDVQYDKNGWRNRNRIKTPNGIQWLTVPVLLKGDSKSLIRDVKINNQESWRKKHCQSIKTNYSKSKFYNHYFYLFEKVYSKEWNFLIDLDMELIYVLCDLLGLKRKIVYSSDLGVQGDKNERLIKICKKFGASIFYEGHAGKDYIDKKVFIESGIEVKFQDYRHPEYNQLYGDFVPYLSVIDLLFNEGDSSLKILTKEQEL